MKCAGCGEKVGRDHNRIMAELNGVRVDLHWWCFATLLDEDSLSRIEQRIAAEGRRIEQRRLRLVGAGADRYQDKPE
jgi:hypothetical protein